MIQIRELRKTQGAQALALALMATALVALAGVGGYEIGSSLNHATPAAAPVVASPQDAPPVTGFQP